MKNKIIINIFIGYLIILTIVLISQIKSKDIVANEAISSNITVEDKIKNSTLLFIESPFYIINEKQVLIDDDTTITPTIINGRVYIPVRFIANAYNATIDFSKSTKKLTIRLNNKAIIFYNNENKIKVIDNTSEEVLEIDETPQFINDRMYIPLRSFAQVFEKEIFFYNNLIVISNIEDIFDPVEELELLDTISKQVKNLPVINDQKKLIELLNSININIKNDNSPSPFEENILDDNLKSIEEELFIKQLQNINFYFDNTTLYGYEDDDLFCEIVLPNADNKNFIIEDILDVEQNLIVIYREKVLENKEPYFYVSIYNSNSSKTEQINGVFSNIYYDKKFLSIISTQEATFTDENKNYITPTLNFETNQKVYFNEIIYFPELNNKLYTTVTNLSLNDNSYLLKKVFLGVGKNVYYYDKHLYFVTEKDNFSFVYLFEINDFELEYTKRIYFDGKFENLEFIKNENVIKITVNSNNAEVSYIFNEYLESLV